MLDTEKFLRDGWVITDIPDQHVIPQLVTEFEKIARCPLPDIHKYYDDNTLEDLRAAMTEYLWSNEYSMKIADTMQPLLRGILGVGLMTQYFPYLRISRPGKAVDNFGFHMDSIFTGITPYEITVQSPLTPVTPASTLKILSGSHRLDKNSFPVISASERDIPHGSIKNRAGYPGGIRRFRPPDGMAMTPILYDPGQAVVFSAVMLLHGMEVNTSNKTRVAIDQHFVNSNAPISILEGKVDTGYVRVPFDAENANHNPPAIPALEHMIGEYRHANH